MSSTADNSKLDAIIAAYVEAIERGEKPDRDQLKAAHPEFAGDLARFFADSDRMQATHLHKGPPIEPTVIPQHEPKPDSFIGGRYKLLQNIGEGGMGSVWVAEQREPVKRKVAIKLIKAGMDSKQVLARFEAERQALAVMDHPNIAKVFDGGITEHGRPYFVMEYVKGVPFTEYCDKARLSLKERLNLFIPVCQAVQHAHHKGIVHRDLKPSNILICLYDGKPVPKVIDFGLAKAMNQSLTEHSIFTGHGVMVGTPLYMSPEQAEHNNLDVDTRTDIYSLGVVLYELLTGTTPLEREQLRTAAYNEVLRLIKEVEPPRPSTRLSGPIVARRSLSSTTPVPSPPAVEKVAEGRMRELSASSSSLDLIARNRSTEPRKLSLLVRGDLDWIVMKSLEKERTRRYETANGLARDIERFLNDEPVEACPPSLAYRLKKFTRKHRGKVIAASLVLSAFLLAIAATTWGWKRASDAALAVKKSLEEVAKERDAKELERARAQLAREDAERANRELFDTFRDTTTDAIEKLISHDDGELPTEAEREFLRKTIERWQAFADRQGDSLQGLNYRAEGLYQVGKAWMQVNGNKEAYDAITASTEIRKRILDINPVDEANIIRLIDCLSLFSQFQDPYNEQKVAEALGLARGLTEKSRTDENLQREAMCLQALGAVQWYRGNPNAHVSTLASITILEESVRRDPKNDQLRFTLAASRGNLASLYATNGESQRSIQQWTAARDIAHELVSGHPNNQGYQFYLSNCHFALASWYAKLAKVPNLPEGFVQVENLQSAAESEFQNAGSIRFELSVKYPRVVEYRTAHGATACNFGCFLADNNRLPESIVWFERAIEILKSAVNLSPLDSQCRENLWISHCRRALVYDALEEYRRAASDWNDAILVGSSLSYSDEKDAPDINELRLSLAMSLLRSGDYEEAISKIDEMYTERLVISESALKSDTALAASEKTFKLGLLHAMAANHDSPRKDAFIDRSLALLQKAIADGYDPEKARAMLQRIENHPSFPMYLELKTTLESMPASPESAVKSDQPAPP